MIRIKCPICGVIITQTPNNANVVYGCNCSHTLNREAFLRLIEVESLRKISLSLSTIKESLMYISKR